VAKKKSAKVKKGPNLTVFYGVLGLVAVVGIGWIGLSVANQDSAAAIAPIELSGLENTDSLLAQAQGVTVGPAEAPVQVLVFSDFTCPACRAFTGLVEPQLKAEFVESDRVRFTYYDFPLGGDAHRYGFVAARAARCAGEQDMFWDYHDVLFGRQNEWAFARDVPLDEFSSYARMLNMDVGVFDACVNSDRYADVVTANGVLGRRLGVGGTPTVFVGGRSVAAWQDYEAVKAAIEAELGGTSGQ
jgi:protein-disulfide isomerase